MIYIVPQKLKDEGFNILFGDRRKVVAELLNSSANEDILVGVDDFLDQRSVLNYLGLNYKVVIGIPNISADQQIMFETASDHLIDFNEFTKLTSAASREELEVKRFLTDNTDQVESRVDQFDQSLKKATDESATYGR